MHNKITPETGQEECGSVKNTGTENAIFIIRIISEQVIQMQNNTHLCLIYLAEVFDMV